MECPEKIYHKNEFGCSRKCVCHNAVHLYFGNISLLLSKQQLKDFSQYISDAVLSCNQEDGDPTLRDFFIPTRDLCIQFAMSYNELKNLLELAEHTLLMLQVDDVLEGNE